MGRESALSRRLGRRLMLGAACVLLVLGLGVITACSPKASAGSEDTAQTPVAETGDTAEGGGEFTVTQAADFTETSTGLFPDTYTNRMLNTGNRGCNSCHVDLWQTTSNVVATNAEATQSGGGHINADRWSHYNRKGTVLDCIGCHSGRIQNTGPYFGDSIHAAHYQSKEFAENGNCWSCHAVTSDEIYTDTNDYDFLLWEEVMYEPYLGGYPTLGQSPDVRFFLQHRGFNTYNLTEMGVDEQPNITVDMSQPLTDIDDIYIIDNHVFDYGVLEDKITVSGAANSKTFTVDELKALPQTTVTCTEECVLNDVNGMLVANIEATGVRLADLVDACGGFADGATNTMTISCYDDWSKVYETEREFLENAILAFQYNGEDLTEKNGYPAVLVIPGCHGGMWCKHISDIAFTAEAEAPIPAVPLFFESDMCKNSTTTFNWVNAGWFANDGVTFSMNEGVTLEGYAFAWDYFAALQSIEFSTDMGVSWQSFDIPANSDPKQWTKFSFHWQPTEPGTYIIKANATNTKGEQIRHDKCASIIVKVTE